MKEWQKDRILYNLSTDVKNSLFDELINKIFDNREELDQFTEELLSSEFWFDLLKAKKECEIRINCKWSISKVSTSILYAIIRKLKPDIIMETGIFTGFSSAIILYALNQNDKGELFSIDTYTKFKDDIGVLVSKDLIDRWTTMEGRTDEVLPHVKTKNIDIFLHDSLHSYDNMYFEYRWAKDHLKKGGLLLSHDIGTNNAFFDFANNNEIKYYLIKSSKFKKFGMGAMII